MSAIRESIHDAITTTFLMLGLVLLLAAIVTLCSCSSSKKSVTTLTEEQTDTAFQRTRQLDLSISRLVTSKDSSWSRIVFYDTTLPVVESTGFPPVKAIIETGNMSNYKSEDNSEVQKADSLSYTSNTEIETIEKKENEVKIVSENPFNKFLYGMLFGLVIVVALFLKFKK